MIVPSNPEEKKKKLLINPFANVGEWVLRMLR